MSDPDFEYPPVPVNPTSLDEYADLVIGPDRTEPKPLTLMVVLSDWQPKEP